MGHSLRRATGSPAPMSLPAMCLAVLVTACGPIVETQPGRVTVADSDTRDDAGVADSADTGAGVDTPSPEDYFPDEALFGPVRQALERGDWLAASLALPQRATTGDAQTPQQLPDPGSPLRAVDAPADTGGSDAENPYGDPAAATGPADNSRERWIDYYRVRIAWLRGDREEHGRLLAELQTRQLPPALRNELLLHRVQIAQARGDREQLVLLNTALKRRGGHPAHPPQQCDAQLWRAAQALDAATLRRLRGNADPELMGWLELAEAAGRPTAAAAASALASWQAGYPEHPGSELATRLLAGATADAGSVHYTLMLPLSGPLGAAAEAVSRGFFAAYYADRERDISIDVLDSRRFASVEQAYTTAVEAGTDVVVGPLGKVQVARLMDREELPVPVLALNRAAEPGAGSAALQLSLAPEDEAWQLAARAFADGGRRALLIRPEGSWGDRMEGALRAHWEALGGRIPSVARYSSAETHSQSIRDALDLGASARRTQELRSLFTERVETQGRRRHDLDAIFLLSTSSDGARSLKPLINYHYAGDLPVYAVSTADTGTDAADFNRDLGGMAILAMPWRLDGGVPGLDPDRGGSFAALHALGADAYRLAGNWRRMASGAGLVVDGFTGSLQADDTGVLRRELKLAEFDRGVLQAR